jgi:uncharacterized PurR-regulated membrane protein YhhQ (DUF165 family)
MLIDVWLLEYLRRSELFFRELHSTPASAVSNNKIFLIPL